MNSFGLGLVLDFVDRATPGMNNASQSFNNMSVSADNMAASVNNSATAIASIAYSLSMVGNTLESVGLGITSLFTNATKTIIDTGTRMQQYRMQLSALYGGVEEGEKVLQEIQQYAMTSVFNIESLIPAVSMMKTVGIEALDEVTTSSGKATQKLLDYASDIAAMIPNMRNVYGTGVQAAMGAMKEYIAEGNALTLKRSAGLDILGILGEKKGATPEERTQQIADLVEELGILGYTTNLVGTPTQRLSNLQDALFNSLMKIADSGVFEVYVGLLEKLSNWVYSLVSNEETFNIITGVIADTVSTLLLPLNKLLDWFIEFSDTTIAWIKEHPVLTRNILLTVAALGVLLTFGGKFLQLLSSIAFAANGLSMLKMFPTLISSLGNAFLFTTGKILPFIALAGIAYFAWQYNLFGIRDLFTNVFGDLTALIQILGDAWSDNTLSEENFIKAKNLGILPLIESILQLKYYWDFFIDGFKTGFSEFFEGLAQSLSWLKVIGIDVMDLASRVGKFLKDLIGIGKEDTWTAIGEAVGKIAGIAVSLLSVYEVLKLFGGLSGSLNLLSKIPIIGGMFGGKKAVSSNIGLNPSSVLKSVISLAIILGGFTVLVLALGRLTQTPGFDTFLTSGVDTLSKLFSNVLPLAIGVGVLSAFVFAMDKLKISPVDAVKGMTNLAVMLGGFSVLIIAIGALTSISGFSTFISSGTDALSSLFASMNVFTSAEFWLMLVAISALGFVPPTAVLTGLANLAMMLGGIGLIISAFGVLAMIPGFDEFITSGGDTLALLFNQLGKVVGSLVGGLAEGVTASLPAIAKDLSDFGTNLQPFFNAVSKAPLEDIGKFMTSFSSFMLMLSGEKILSFITGGVDLPKLGTELSQFGTNASAFFLAVASYPEEGIKKAGEVFSALEKIGDFSFRTGGVAQAFTGETSLKVIGEQLAAFAPNGSVFFNAVAGYSEEGIDKSKRVFEALSYIGAYEFRSGGLAQLITGGVNLADIGEQLSKFGVNAAEFFNISATFSEDGITKGKRSLEILKAIGNAGINTGGIFSLFTGGIDLENIGSQLASFGTEAVKYFNAVSVLSYESIYMGERVLDVLASLGNTTFRNGGLLQLFIGGVDISNLANNLSQFGMGSSTFFNIAATLPEEGFSKAKSLFSAIGSMSEITDVVIRFGGNTLSHFGEELVAFIDSAEQFFIRAGSFSTDSVYNVTNALTPFFNTVTAFNVAKLSEIARGLENVSNTTTVFSSTLGRVVTEIQGHTSNALSVLRMFTTDALAVLNSFSSKGYSIGASLMQSIARGISANAYLIQNAVQRAVNNIKVSIPNIASSASRQASSQANKMIGLATGGYVKEQGIAVLHPNEVVVNDEITQKLDNFLDEVEKKEPVVNNASIMQNYVVRPLQMPQNEVKTENDYSVTFNAGSIVIQLANASDAELEKAAEKIMNMISRKQQLRAMAIRT